MDKELSPRRCISLKRSSTLRAIRSHCLSCYYSVAVFPVCVRTRHRSHSRRSRCFCSSCISYQVVCCVVSRIQISDRTMTATLPALYASGKVLDIEYPRFPTQMFELTPAQQLKCSWIMLGPTTATILCWTLISWIGAFSHRV